MDPNAGKVLPETTPALSMPPDRLTSPPRAQLMTGHGLASLVSRDGRHCVKKDDGSWCVVCTIS